MKDIIENRSRISLVGKFQLLVAAVRENGLLWTTLMAFYYITSSAAQSAYSTAAKLRTSRGLPGLNSLRMNTLIWNSWDWSEKGEEWTISPEWKDSVVKHFLLPNVPLASTVLEIGPGGGRWTEYLIDQGRTITAVDISSSAIETCKKRFAHATKAQFIVGNGVDLRAVADQSMDAVWSFDVFVHINKDQFSNYTHEIKRVLKPGGRAVIHHGSTGGATGGWRSNVTGSDVSEIVKGAGLVILSQSASWQDGGQQFKSGLYGDVISVLSSSL